MEGLELGPEFTYPVARDAEVIVWLGKALCSSLPLSVVIAHICLFPSFFFPSLWLWAPLSGNGLYFLPDGTCAAGKDCGEKKATFFFKGEKELFKAGNGRNSCCERNDVAGRCQKPPCVRLPLAVNRFK